MLKDQLFKTSGLQFDNWLFGLEKFSVLLLKQAPKLIEQSVCIACTTDIIERPCEFMAPKSPMSAWRTPVAVQAPHVWSQFYRLTKLGTNRSLDGWYSEVQFPHFGERIKSAGRDTGQKFCLSRFCWASSSHVTRAIAYAWTLICRDKFAWSWTQQVYQLKLFFFVFYWWNFIKGHRTGHVFKVYLCFRLFQARGKCFYPNRKKDTNVFERFHDNNMES